MAKASTTLGGLTFTARANGGSGNLIGIAVLISALPVFATASGNLITITLQHDGVDLVTSISTTADVEAAIQVNPGVNALIESSAGDASIFPYVDPPIGYTYLTGGSETLLGFVAVASSLSGRLRKFATLAGTSIATAAMSGSLARNASAAVAVSSSSTVDAILSRFAASSVVATSSSDAIPSLSVGVQSDVFASSSASLSAGVHYQVQGAAVATSRASANPDLVRTSLTICDVIRDILLAWGIEQPCSAPKMAKIAALNVLNQGMQVLWNQAKDRNYWTQSTLALAVNSGSNTQILTDSIQNVIGPARLSTGETLVPLANISELENFNNSFLEASSSALPCAYYIERNYQSGDDPARCTLMITPTPSTNITINVDVVTESPRYTLIDFDKCPICPIPHKYVESLLLPVCRYLAMHSYLFVAREQQEAIVAGYAQARQLLDVADPLPGMSGENAKFRKEGAES
jgi:hypothetical protein